MVFDMNSTNGTYINDEKIIVKKINLGDTIRLANIAFELKPYNAKELPPVLDSLDPESGEASINLPDLPKSVSANITAADIKKVVPKTSGEGDVPYIIYPLEQDPKAEFSEYIFEDTETLYPIFKYEIGKSSVEIIILHQDNVFSVDYLPAKNGTYYLEGLKQSKESVEFPYLAKNHRQEFVQVQNDLVSVYNLPDYEVLHLSDNNVKRVPNKNSVIQLADHDLVKLSKGSLQLYIRKTSAPPKVKTAPIFRRDQPIKRYILLALLFIIVPMFFLKQYEVDKEIEKDKAPERIATILYQEKFMISKNDAIKKTEKAKPVAQTSPKKQVKPDEPKVDQKQDTPKKDPPKKVVTKTAEPVGKKTAPKVEEVKKAQTKPAPEKVAAKKPSPQPGAQTPSPTPVKTIKTASTPVKTVTTAKGNVDVFKSADFSAQVSSLMAKGGSVTSTTAQSDSSFSEASSVRVGGGAVESLKKADVAQDTGSLTGSTVGKIGESKGVEGLSAKKTIHTAGIPSETVVLGAMDPDIIRRILRENIPQFRYCYQKELDSRGNEDSGIVHLNFVIGASGHVSKSGVDRSKSSRISPKVQSCVLNVLNGIQFPRPAGGATVEVSQPINFYPKRL
jgi:outer membrane biosynthesis protein TonB